MGTQLCCHHDLKHILDIKNSFLTTAAAAVGIAGAFLGQGHKSDWRGGEKITNGR